MDKTSNEQFDLFKNQQKKGNNMSLEAEIKKLITAIEELNANLAKQGGKKSKEVEAEDEEDEDEDLPKKKAKKGKVAKSDPIDEDEDEEEEAEDDADEEDEDEEEETPKKLSADKVKAFAKTKMAEGTDRKDIKKLVKKLGGDQISDLDDKGLAKLYAKLKAL